jgi:SAM-dependent methyltransferase
MNAVLKPADYSELLIGCGNSRVKKIRHGDLSEQWQNLTTLDIDVDCKPDVVHDMAVFPLPFADNSFDEIHAYEVLEHTGTQGDWRFFFNQFAELYRIIKPGGLLIGTCPMWDSQWAWGDPGHTRIINKTHLLYLNQDLYKQEVGQTTVTDYRWYWKGDFEMLAHVEQQESFGFVLRARK